MLYRQPVWAALTAIVAAHAAEPSPGRESAGCGASARDPPPQMPSGGGTSVAAGPRSVAPDGDRDDPDPHIAPPDVAGWTMTWVVRVACPVRL